MKGRDGDRTLPGRRHCRCRDCGGCNNGSRFGSVTMLIQWFCLRNRTVCVIGSSAPVWSIRPSPFRPVPAVLMSGPRSCPGRAGFQGIQPLSRGWTRKPVRRTQATGRLVRCARPSTSVWKGQRLSPSRRRRRQRCRLKHCTPCATVQISGQTSRRNAIRVRHFGRGLQPCE